MLQKNNHYPKTKGAQWPRQMHVRATMNFIAVDFPVQYAVCVLHTDSEDENVSYSGPMRGCIDKVETAKRVPQQQGSLCNGWKQGSSAVPDILVAFTPETSLVAGYEPVVMVHHYWLKKDYRTQSFLPACPLADLVMP